MERGHDFSIEFYINKLIPNDLNGYTILDFGCSTGFWGWYIRANKKGNPNIIGIDIYKPLEEFHKKVNIYNDFYLYKNNRLHTLLEIILYKYFRYNLKKFNLIICTEVLEHINKNEGLRIKEILDSYSNHIIFSTPLGFYPQIPNENPYMKHLSGWDLKDFKGYKTMIFSPYPDKLYPFIKIYNLIHGRKSPKFIVAWK